MKLSRVIIKNFRSIKDSSINFEKPCRVLVGINESGKSNVLKALRLLSEDYKPSKRDVREGLAKEPQISEAYVYFIFKFSQTNSEELFSDISRSVCANEDDPEIVVVDRTTLPLSAFCRTRDEGSYFVDVLRERRFGWHPGLPSNYKLASGWKKPARDCPDDYRVASGDGTRVLKSLRLVRAKDFPEIPTNYLENATISDLGLVSERAIVSLVEANLPDTVFWEYDERDLLPNSIDISAFADKPADFAPLTNMFILAGIGEDDIEKSITNALQGSLNHTQNYLKRIAEQTTAHFRDVWAEYRDIEFSLHLNGNTIVPGIKEANTHDFANRSDGFKRFVTFLLMISVKVKTEQMENTLLIIDEPEISLHPSGARYLRDELIRISKNNYVIFSTHSIFMIDATDIGRHYIVKKKGEITTLKEAETSNLAEEEVLLNALGYSAFEILSERNLIFEGWKDRRLFEVAISTAPTDLKRKFASVGICHARGVSSIKVFTPLIQLAKRSCLIVSDSDAPARSEQKRYKADRGVGTWLTYQEVDPTIKAVTGEDFVKKQFVAASVNAVLEGKPVPKFEGTDLPTDNNKLNSIGEWLKVNGIVNEDAKTVLNGIKEHLFDHLEPSWIEVEYEKLLRGIKP